MISLAEQSSNIWSLVYAGSSCAYRPRDDHYRIGSHQYGDWTREAWKWAMEGRVTRHRLLGHMMQ